MQKNVSPPSLSLSLAQAHAALAAQQPDGVALWTEAGSITRASLDEQSRRVAAGFARLGVKRGDRVAIWLPNVPAWLVCFLALARLGAIAIATNTRFRSREIADIWSRAGVKGVVFWPHYRNIEFARLLQGARDELPALDFLIAYEDTGPGGAAADESAVHGLAVPTLPYAALAGEAPHADDQGEASLPVVTFTTSGTTGRPKLATHTQGSILRHALAVAPAFGFDAPGACVLQMLPFCGTYGLAQTMAALYAGAPMVLQHTFDPPAAAALMRARHTTHGCMNLDLVQRIYAAAGDPATLPRMKFFMGATGMPLAEREDSLGFRVRGLYGSSEVQALYSLQDDVADPVARISGGGKPVSPQSQVRARKVGGEPGHAPVLPHGEWGELEFCGPGVMTGYLNDPQATAKAFTADGWFRSGDLGYTLADGSFRFVSRMGDAIRLGGFLVDPHEIEAFIEEFPGVEVCQVVGVEIEGRTRAVAFYTCMEPEEGAIIEVAEAELRRHCREGLAAYKTPQCFVQLEEFPVVVSANNTKIRRAELRNMAERILKDGAGPA
jgi:fatty-acyl-CoA synthase